MNSFHARLLQELEDRDSRDLRRALRGVPAGALDLASNDYMGFARHPRVIEAACDATRKFGAGARASRLVSGNLEPHRELEKALSKWKSCESALLFPSGYAANLAVVSALAQRGDLVLCDKRNHASLIDACKLAQANGAIVRFYSGLQKLRFLLADSCGALVVSDAVYSMDGDLADVSALLQLCEEFDATLILDDAHGTGTLGASGHGAIEHFGLSYNDRVVQIGTLSKALGSQGGFVAASQVVVDYLVNAARPFIYTTALAPASCGAALQSLQLLRSEPQHLQRLRAVKNQLARGLKELGFDVRESESPILPVIIGDAQAAMAMSARLLELNVWCPAIRPPTVRAGTSRLRVTASAALSDSDIARALAAFAQAQSTPE